MPLFKMPKVALFFALRMQCIINLCSLTNGIYTQYIYILKGFRSRLYAAPPLIDGYSCFFYFTSAIRMLLFKFICGLF